MNLQLEAAWKLHQVLEGAGIRYVIIGGLAVQHWGEPRLTRDVDATVLVTPGHESGAMDVLLGAFQPRRADAREFAMAHRVLLLHAPGLCDLDVSFGLPGYEDEVAGRASELDIGEARRVRICSAEDLIIHKAIAGRPKDVADVTGIVHRQRGRLDIEYIRGWLTQFGELLDNPEVLNEFEKTIRQR